MTAPKMELRRPMEAEPKEGGWYYGSPTDAPAGINFIMPVEVSHYGKDGPLIAVVRGEAYPLKMLNWFGTVPTCVEATK